MFSGICAALAKQAARRCHGDFLKEKGLITSLPKDATPKIFFFVTLKHRAFYSVWFLDCCFFPVTFTAKKNDLIGKKESRCQLCFCFLY